MNHRERLNAVQRKRHAEAHYALSEKGAHACRHCNGAGCPACLDEEDDCSEEEAEEAKEAFLAEQLYWKENQ